MSCRYKQQTEMTGYENHAFHEESPREPKKFDENRNFCDASLKYGWGSINCKCVQFFNKPIFFLLCVSCLSAFQGVIVSSFSSTSLSSIEKQFGYKSTEVALFTTFYDVAYGICCIFVGYVGYNHKPRWLGWGALIMSVGALLYTLPRHIDGEYFATDDQYSSLCVLKNSTSNSKLCIEGSHSYYKLIFILCQILIGVGATPIYTLGVAHLDEITMRGENSIYMGVFYGFAAFGPGLGYVIGMPVYNVWVDFKQPDGIQLTPEDNNWIGAWWLGFVIGAVLLLLPVIPMLGFPRLFPNAEILKENKKSFEDTVEEDHNLKHDFKSIWPATKALLKNKPFMLICLASASESLGVGGFSTFFPKLVQTQFHFTASNASFSTGLIVIPGVAGGIFLGGYMIKKLQWTCRKTLRGSALFAFISTLLVAVVLLGCDGRDVTGANVAYPNSEPSNISLINTCNSGCSCSTKYYKPVCSKEDGRTYFSACHAGCTTQSDKIFKNCTCLPPGTSNVEEGRCTPSCKLFPAFAIGAFLLFFFTFLNNVPMVNATFRVVPEGQGSFAMGFQQIFIRFLGFIPAPTLFGSFVDKSCKLWQIDECTGDTTSCLEYENKDFRLYIFALGVMTKFLSFVFIFMAFKLYKLPSSKLRMSNLQNRPNTADKIEDELARIEDETLNTGA